MLSVILLRDLLAMPAIEPAHDWKDLPEPAAGLAPRLVTWFGEHGRDFPWRHTTDPFLTLSAELMLQRTRADQVVPVFEQYRERFRGPADVVAAGRDEVDAIFARLGLVWRAEYFWRLQGRLAEAGGEIPRDVPALVQLPGVGRYAATATAVFAFGIRATVVDANVLRVLGRWYGIEFPDHARRSPRVAEWATRHSPVAGDAVRAFNWALIDLGADVCTPLSPRCEECPIVDGCRYAAGRG